MHVEVKNLLRRSTKKLQRWLATTTNCSFLAQICHFCHGINSGLSCGQGLLAITSWFGWSQPRGATAQQGWREDTVTEEQRFFKVHEGRNNHGMKLKLCWGTGHLRMSGKTISWALFYTATGVFCQEFLSLQQFLFEQFWGKRNIC